MRILLYTLFLLLINSTLLAQNKMTNIKIGQKVPDVMITKIHDASYSSGSLSDMSKDKLLILDFWATWCAPCLYALPKLDSLQQEFNEQLSMILITSQEEELVRSFLKTRAERGLFVSALPKVFEDTKLRDFFPHNTVPHYVWIKNNQVIAITEFVDKQQIEKAIAGEQLTAVTKIDVSKVEYNRDKMPLVEFLYGSANADLSKNMDTYSILTKFIPELGYNGGTSTEWDSLGNVRRITSTNISLNNLYRMAYGKMRTFINNGAVDILSSDSLIGAFDVSGMAALPIIEKISFCYEVASPKDNIFEKMQQDLKFGFPQFTVKVLEVVDTCLVLEKFNDNIEKYVVGSDSDSNEINTNSSCISRKNYEMGWFRTILEAFVFRYGKLPIVDETGFTKRFNIEICDHQYTVEGLNKAMEPYGLRLTKKLAKHERLVIDKNK